MFLNETIIFWLTIIESRQKLDEWNLIENVLNASMFLSIVFLYLSVIIYYLNFFPSLFSKVLVT